MKSLKRKLLSDPKVQSQLATSLSLAYDNGYKTTDTVNKGLYGEFYNNVDTRIKQLEICTRIQLEYKYGKNKA